MRRSGYLATSISALSLGVCLAASPADAASLPFTGTLTIRIANLQPLVVSGSGVATVNGSGGGAHINSLTLPAGAFATTALTLPTTDPANFPLEAQQLTVQNGPGSPLLPGGVMGLLGSLRICLFAGGMCQPPGAPIANIVVPLGVVGVGGAATAAGAVNVTVTGAPWTTGTAAIGSVTAMGFRHGPASATSSTAMTSGVLQLVTPFFISTNIPADGGEHRRVGNPDAPLRPRTRDAAAARRGRRGDRRRRPETLARAVRSPSPPLPDAAAPRRQRCQRREA